jgi:hypothetical protein
MMAAFAKSGSDPTLVESTRKLVVLGAVCMKLRYSRMYTLKVLALKPTKCLQTGQKELIIYIEFYCTEDIAMDHDASPPGMHLTLDSMLPTLVLTGDLSQVAPADIKAGDGVLLARIFCTEAGWKVILNCMVSLSCA